MCVNDDLPGKLLNAHLCFQLPPNRTSEHYTYRSFTDIRWAQTANYGRMPNEVMKKMYLAATIDLPQNSTEIIDGSV